MRLLEGHQGFREEINHDKNRNPGFSSDAKVITEKARYLLTRRARTRKGRALGSPMPARVNVTSYLLNSVLTSSGVLYQYSTGYWFFYDHFPYFRVLTSVLFLDSPV